MVAKLVSDESVPKRGQSVLQAELNKLKKITKMGHELTVHHQPDTILNREGMVLRGKVVGTVILIFDKDLKKAKETLKHEFFEYLIDKSNEPYRKLLNLFMQHFQTMLIRREKNVSKH